MHRITLYCRKLKPQTKFPIETHTPWGALGDLSSQDAIEDPPSQEAARSAAHSPKSLSKSK